MHHYSTARVTEIEAAQYLEAVVEVIHGSPFRSHVTPRMFD